MKFESNNPLENLETETAKNRYEHVPTVVSILDVNQTTTRGDGVLEKTEMFLSSEIDYAAASHINIHMEGKIAGSQFNGEVFRDSDALIETLREGLPHELWYDQFDRCELTVEFRVTTEKPVGWTGVKNLEEVMGVYPNAKVVKSERMQGGLPDTVDGIEGNWYPEMAKDPETGKFVVVKDENGNVKNEKAKFEPLANIVEIPDGCESVLETNKVTIILQKDKQTGRPAVLTTFPGENAPAFPARISTEFYNADTLDSLSPERKFWDGHALLKRK